MSEDTKLLLTKEGSADFKELYPKPLSLCWRVCHSSAYMLGGLTFLIGSIQYFPTINNLVLGGWLFAIGSVGLLFADALEWWTNNRVGCFAYNPYEEVFEEVMGDRFGDKHTWAGRYQRAENGMNFFTNVTGSLLYLIGGVMFIPSLNSIVLGSYLFIYGSGFIVVSQSWKLYRSACFNKDPKDKRFRVTNWTGDLPGFFIDLFTGLGGVAYFVGSFDFLPQYDVTNTDAIIAADWFTGGGACFFLAAVCICYRYYCTRNYPHESRNDSQIEDDV